MEHKEYIQVYFEEDDEGDSVVAEEFETDEFWFNTYDFAVEFEIWKKDTSLGYEAWRTVARSATYKGV